MASQVVIVGAGFGGLYAARELCGGDVDVTIVDRKNHHCFQPLLYQVATAALSPGEIAQPVRTILAGCDNTVVRLGEVAGIDPKRRVVRLSDGELPYDHLILAAGARHAYFGKDEWARFAPGLKTIEDALSIRNRLLAAFEKAEHEIDFKKRDALTTFVVVGGGPTGVELAGAFAEIARHALRGEFRHVDPALARIVLLEAG
ncbi:MAG: FAD-dependent oxidoreductase, partial [Elusimicrobia bacterium]|nr:FAD-dependent oxidoreductase [Elusimicrobiota bacterium]